MTAVVIPFPHYRVRITRDEGAWLVIVRDHGWVHGSHAEAGADARWLADNHGVPIIDRSRSRSRSEYPENHEQEKAMVEYDDTNRGALFRAQKEKENDRDYSGTINVGGTNYWLSGWVKTSKKGAKYLSLRVKPTDADQSKPQRRDSVDDEPF